MAIAGTRQDTAASQKAAAEIMEIARSTGDMELEVASLMQLAWSSQPTLDAAAFTLCALPPSRGPPAA